MQGLWRRAVGVGVGIGIAGAALGAAGDQTFGAGVKTKEVTSIKALYEAPEKFLGKTIRLDGVVTAVCEEMGCWMALAAEAQPAQTVRFKAEDGVIVFPTSARGKHASAEGVFEKITTTDGDGHDAAHAHGAQQPAPAEFGKTYHVKVTGAVVREK